MSEELELEVRLAKIRSQITSKLDNQKHLAIILSAVEENIAEQNNDKSPVAYFVSFLALLDQAVQGDDIIDTSLATTTTYFLDIVFPYTPPALLRSKFADILAKLATPLTSSNADAPLVRSTIGALESLLRAQDHQQWQSTSAVSPKRALLGLLELSFDPRPKVRKRAQDAVHAVLSHPPTSPTPIHVAAPLAGDVSLRRLRELLAEAKNSRSKDTHAHVIHCLQLIAQITSANSWPVTQIEPLCDALLEISKTSDQYLVSLAFAAFTGLFQSMQDAVYAERFARVLDAIFDLKPSVNDTHLAALWLAVVSKAMESYAQIDAVVCMRRLRAVVVEVSQFLAAESSDIYLSAAQCLIAVVSQTIPDSMLLQNGNSAEVHELVDDTVEFLAEHIASELFSVGYQHAIREILEFVAATVHKLRSRCNPDFLAVLETVGAWRTNESDMFPNKEAEDVIAACISTIGPAAVLSVLPLNLTGASGAGRAWMLPLLRDNVRLAELQFFKREILPLVEVFEGKMANSSALHAKIFATIVDQVWSLLPHFCDLPRDLRVGFDDEFAQQLSDLMYSRVELRVPICHALRLLVESNTAYADGALADDLLVQEEFAPSELRANLEYLASKASNIVSVLFNVYSATPQDSRGFVMETIDVYLQIVSKEDLEASFNKVCEVLSGALKEVSEATPEEVKPKKAGKAGGKDAHSEAASLASTMMDLVVAMAKYVPSSLYNALLAIFAQTVGVSSTLLQKRSYRILSRMAESDSGRAAVVGFVGDIERVLIESGDTVLPAARASRLTAIDLLLSLECDLYFIPAVVQEIIMCTKDANERSRALLYLILNKMGYKMMNGGVVENRKVPGFDEDAPDSAASLDEYFTMVSAGLAAQAPHMISATITALSCLVFEFKDKLSASTLTEILSTVELFLTHNSREIAKSAIGFVKVEVLSLPEDMVRANLSELLAKLMRWSHEHKDHFKLKVKHIVERLIRKFGVEDVEAAMPEEDKKLVANIKKARNRAKRNKDSEEGEGEGPAPEEKRKFVSAYEEALYDSDVSDDEQSDDDEPSGKKNKKKSNQFILNTGDEPLDLLDRQMLAHISLSKPKKMTLADVKKKTDVQTKGGKLVFDEGDPLASKGSGIDAYLDAVKQAPVRGQKNKLKWAKGKKAAEDDWSDDEEDVREKPKEKVKKARVQKPKQKFKAKKKL